MSFIRLILTTTLIALPFTSCHSQDASRSATATTDADSATAATAAAAECRDFQHVGTLPSVLREASGIAWSHALPDVLWVHNDGGNPDVIFALDTLGHIRARVRIETPFTNMDWEDIAVSDCGGHDCIYLADTGDNMAKRDFVRVLRFAEPRPNRDTIAHPEAFPFRYPDGSHDAEAIFVLPGERLFVVTKGRNAGVALFRYPGSLRHDTVTLEHVRNLTDGISQFPAMVTAASASPDGRRVAIRTYSFLRLYVPTADGDLAADPGDSISLEPAHEFQGEGLTIDNAGRVFLVGERGLDGSAPPVSRLQCTALQGMKHAP